MKTMLLMMASVFVVTSVANGSPGTSGGALPTAQIKQLKKHLHATTTPKTKETQLEAEQK